MQSKRGIHSGSGPRRRWKERGNWGEGHCPPGFPSRHFGPRKGEVFGASGGVQSGYRLSFYWAHGALRGRCLQLPPCSWGTVPSTAVPSTPMRPGRDSSAPVRPHGGKRSDPPRGQGDRKTKATSQVLATWRAEPLHDRRSAVATQLTGCSLLEWRGSAGHPVGSGPGASPWGQLHMPRDQRGVAKSHELSYCLYQDALLEGGGWENGRFHPMGCVLPTCRGYLDK